MKLIFDVALFQRFSFREPSRIEMADNLQHELLYDLLAYGVINEGVRISVSVIECSFGHTGNERVVMSNNGFQRLFITLFGGNNGLI